MGEIDVLTGRKGHDVFVLGQISPFGTPTIFYSDGDVNTAGTIDYASIEDFNPEGKDKIQLAGEVGDYSLGVAPDRLPSGTGIYFNDGASPELIAIVVDVQLHTLDLSNSEQFMLEI